LQWKTKVLKCPLDQLARGPRQVRIERQRLVIRRVAAAESSLARAGDAGGQGQGKQNNRGAKADYSRRSE
jgi:hypothetical protein